MSTRATVGTVLSALVKMAVPLLQEAERQCPRTGPGAKPEVPDWVMGALIMVAVLKRKKTKSAQFRFLSEKSNRAQIRDALGRDDFLARSGFFRRYRRAYVLYRVAVRLQAAQAVAEGVADPQETVVDKTLIVLQGQIDELGQVVLVMDEEYGHQGPTTAEFLLDRGKEVDLITSQETIANFLGATTRPPLLRRLFTKGAQIFNHLEPRAIKDRCLVARNIWTGELHEVGPYDSFVYAYGGVSVDTLSQPLREKGVAVEVLGDAFAPRSLQHAILEGHRCGREL